MGMSSGILADNIEEIAKDRDIDVEIDCYFSSNFRELDYEDVDMILMAPQVRNMEEQVKEYTEEYGSPVMLIDREDYGLMRGDVIFTNIMEKLNN